MVSPFTLSRAFQSGLTLVECQSLVGSSCGDMTQQGMLLEVSVPCVMAFPALPCFNISFFLQQQRQLQWKLSQALG